jgi:hypothetical protein
MGGMRKVYKGTYRAKEADMTKGFDDVSNSNIAQHSTFTMPDSAVTANILAIVAEVTDYSKQYLDNRAAFVEKLLGAKSVASAVQIQSDYAKTSFEGVVAQATRMGELYSNLARVTFKACGVAIAPTYTKLPKV